jgi:hypothetical protein
MTTTDEETSAKRPWRRHGFYGPLYGGVWVVVIGVIFLLNNFGYLQGNAWGKLWPLFIIIPGLFMIGRGFRSC